MGFKRPLKTTIGLVLFCYFLQTPYLTIFAVAQQSQTDTTDAQTDVVFVPPPSGAPADRVGAATRDAGPDEGSVLALLAPVGGGITTLLTPPLAWYLSETFAGKMYAELVSTQNPQVGVVKVAEGKFRKGYYALDLERSDMVLEQGAIYKWTVLLTAAQSGQVVDQRTTYVEIVDQPISGLSQIAAVLAAQGLWFDALAPFVEIGLSGKVSVQKGTGFESLMSSAGLDLP